MRNVVFDFGGVLMKHDKEGCLKNLRHLLSDEDITNVIGFGNDNNDTLRARFERGECDTRYFLERVLALCQPGTTEQQVTNAWNKLHAGISDEAWETIRQLRAQGYHTYLMSNTDEIHWQHSLAFYRQQIESLFDDVFLSFELGMTKPAEAFFRHVANAIGDGQTIFVDDMEANRIAAQQYIGWQTYASIEELKDVNRVVMSKDIQTTELTRTSQSWDGVQLPHFPKGKPELTVLRMTFPVGAVTGWHHHTAVNYGIVEQGELTIVCQDGNERTFHEGEALVEVVGTIHRGENRGNKPVILDMFYFAEPGQVLTIQHPEIQ